MHEDKGLLTAVECCTRTLPLGMSENTCLRRERQRACIPTNGQTTQYIYDANNRLAQKLFPDSSQVVACTACVDPASAVTDVGTITYTRPDE